MGQTCCTHKNVENSQTLVKEENKTQPDIEKIASKQDLAGTDDTASKHGKNKNFEKQLSSQAKNRTPTFENDQEKDSFQKSKSKNEEKENKISAKEKDKENEKEKGSQIDNVVSSNLALELKQQNTLSGNEDFDNQSKKNKDSGTKLKEIKKEPSIDLFMDLPGPPPNLREINKKAQSSKFQKSDNQLKSD
ncbi:hypothetical protein ABPG72_016018 [Tetrahymena utriculariae]